MDLGASLDVYRRTDEGGPGTFLGTAVLVQPDLAQAVPPLDTLLSTAGVGGSSFVVRAHGDERADPVDVRRPYPGLVSPAEADRIAAQECPSLRLVEGADVLVFLALAQALAEPDPDEICSQGTLCKIVCLWYCTSC